MGRVGHQGRQGQQLAFLVGRRDLESHLRLPAVVGQMLFELLPVLVLADQGEGQKHDRQQGAGNQDQKLVVVPLQEHASQLNPKFAARVGHRHGSI